VREQSWMRLCCLASSSGLLPGNRLECSIGAGFVQAVWLPALADDTRPDPVPWRGVIGGRPPRSPDFAARGKFADDRVCGLGRRGFGGSFLGCAVFRSSRPARQDTARCCSWEFYDHGGPPAWPVVFHQQTRGRAAQIHGRLEIGHRQSPEGCRWQLPAVGSRRRSGRLDAGLRGARRQSHEPG
jgi:hypothetical protein